MSNTKARKADRGTRTAVITLTLDENARLRALAAKFGLPTELTANRLLLAAITALEDLDEFTWPLWLEPTSQADQDAQSEARRQARESHDRALIEQN